MKWALLLFMLVCIVKVSYSNVRMPKIFSNGMVLQRDKDITLWGWADPGEKVTATLNKQSKSGKTGKDGKWKITLEPEQAGGPFQLMVKGKNQLAFTDVLVGEVWICSGQSNMEWPVRISNNAEEEIRTASYPHIRQFLVEKSVSSQPQEDVTNGDWTAALPATVGDFTAVGYFFAREIHLKTGVPIGLINTSWGGTHSETWTSREAFLSSNEFRPMIEKMPVLDLDSLAKQKQEAVVRHLASLGLSLPTGKEPDSWKDSELVDTHWPAMSLPQSWEKILTELDGVVWFRKQVTLTAEQANGNSTLSLGVIDDNDETYVNGVKVGSTQSWNTTRVYPVPASTLKAGINTIAVKVTDTGGGGGLYGEPKDLVLSLASGSSLALAGDWRYQVQELYNSASVSPNSYPTLLFNAMLHPLRNFGIRGAIWYQGESNAGRAFQYRQAFPLMITDWRKQFNQGDFPFYFVQLASYEASGGTSENGSSWAELREAQSMTLSLPATGMAVTTDIGEAHDIHPRNKQDVGKRLAALALNRTYAMPRTDSGPVYSGMTIEGNKVRIQFTEIGSGLLAKDKYGYLKGFELAGNDQKFKYAKAWLEGNTVVVSCDAITQPVAVRYAWADNPEDSNLYNSEGFPAAPFRSDKWKGITESEKFTY